MNQLHAEKTREFLDEVFEGQEGYVYVPTKNPETEHFQQYFFRWPEQRDQIVSHIAGQSPHVDCYYAPSIFKSPSDKKQAWKGSNYVWVEFDGEVPQTLPEGVPEPTIRIRSSTNGHEHWYWRMKDFETDQKVLEQLTKQLTYTLGADLSGWDCAQVLRPPGTLHHESGRRVRVLKAKQSKYGYEDFTNLAQVPKDLIINTNIKEVPDVKDVLRKYKWPDETYELFTRTGEGIPSKEKKNRSSAMSRLAFDCAEMGMTNEEIYSVLYNADERWGKFRSRPPEQRAKRLVGIIQHVRSKKSYDSELLLQGQPVFQTVGDFLATEIEVKWLFENLLHDHGSGVIASMPGVGKSQVSFQMAIHAALGRDFLKWPCHKQTKSAIVSLEMGEVECKQFLNTMLQGYTEEEKYEISRNIIIYAPGSKWPLDRPDAQKHLLEALDQHEVGFVVIDSLNKAVTKVKDEEAVDRFYNFIDRDIRSARGCAVWVIHHLRKPEKSGSREPEDIADLYGDAYIGANPTTVIALWKVNHRKIKVLNFKTRLARETDPFWIERTDELNFRVTGEPVDTPVAKKEGGKDGKEDSKSSGGISL